MSTRALASPTNRSSNRFSALQSLIALDQGAEIEDELARAQKRLRELKARISAQSKKNFVLERDVRYLDSRIALLIQNVSRILPSYDTASILPSPRLVLERSTRVKGGE